jgi:hypothetical protein
MTSVILARRSGDMGISSGRWLATPQIPHKAAPPLILAVSWLRAYRSEILSSGLEATLEYSRRAEVLGTVGAGQLKLQPV